MSKKKNIGGDLIGDGSFGCVFYPAIKCKGQKNINKNTVSKIFFSSKSKQESLSELKINNIIRKIKGYEKWANIWDKNCKPDTYSNIEKSEIEIETCLYNNRVSEYDFNKYSRMLQGKHAGVKLDDVFYNLFNKSVFKNKKLFIKNFLQMMRLMKPLFIGLVEMYKNNISHNDIKFDNIMVDNNGCKFIDFGLASKTTNLKFYKQRSMSEFVHDRIYTPYPYEFIYLFATKEVLEDELDDKVYSIHRDLHNRYNLIHETFFGRKDLKKNLLELINISKDKKFLKNKYNIISLLDTYSLGVIIPYGLITIAKKNNKLELLRNYINSTKVYPFFELLKSMTEPDFNNRINPIGAYNRYLELEKIYLSNNSKKICKRTKQTKRCNK